MMWDQLAYAVGRIELDCTAAASDSAPRHRHVDDVKPSRDSVGTEVTPAEDLPEGARKTHGLVELGASRTSFREPPHDEVLRCSRISWHPVGNRTVSLGLGSEWKPWRGDHLLMA